MKTLEIRNGDLAIGRGGHATVEGGARLRQDLAVAMREPYGSDRFHPRWGFLLNEYVGGVLDEVTKQQVIGECRRVVANYIGIQQQQMAMARASGSRPRFSSGEVIDAVQGIEVRQTYDRLYVRVVVHSVSGESVSLVSAVGV